MHNAAPTKGGKTFLKPKMKSVCRTDFSRNAGNARYFQFAANFVRFRKNLNTRDHRAVELLTKHVSKKVLLRECKRHTDPGVSSTPSAALSGGVLTLAGEGYLSWLGGTPSLDGGYPHHGVHSPVLT